MLFNAADNAIKTIASANILVADLIPELSFVVFPSASITWIRFYGSTVFNRPLS
jgi:hypothetical protein